MIRSLSARYRHLLAAGLLLALPFIMFWRIWWPAPALRQVITYGDFVEQHYLMRVFAARELSHGRLPLWDPYTFGGQPAVAATLFQVFYPLGLWQVLLPDPLPFLALELEVLFHLGLAGLFTYLFVYRLTRSYGAGLVAGLAFGLGGWLTSYPIQQINILETAVWLPLGLWLIEGAVEGRSLAGLFLAGAAMGISLLAGHPQTTLYMAYLAGAYFLFRALGRRAGWRFTAAGALLMLAGALGISAAQWIPGLEMHRMSPRAGLTYADIAHGFQWADLLGIVRARPGEWSPLYVGLLPLLLALAGLVVKRRGPALFWGAASLTALLLSLGGNGFLFPIAYRILPGFNLFRDQERLAYIVSFALAVLAGCGYAALAGRWHRVRRALPALLALTALDLYLAHGGANLQTEPPGGYFPVTPAVAHLLSDPDENWRVSSEGLLPADGNAGLLFEIRDVVGNGPLHLAAYDAFIEKVPEFRWWRMLNVRYVLTRRTLSHGGLLLVVDEGERRLYQTFLGAQPAWIVHEYRLAPDQDAAIEMTAGGGLDPWSTAVLETAPQPAPAPAAGEESFAIRRFSAQRIELDVQLRAPGILVLSEIAYPGWTVRVNGRLAPPLRAYGILRAVALPAGAWHVEWSYQPRSVYAGIALGLLTLLGSADIVAARGRRR
ncbi:MAG: hypothetical protein ACP5TV_05880 [Anaerolineae bacterium]